MSVPPGRLLLSLDVVGRPATFATAHELAWKEAVRGGIAKSGITPLHGRFAVRIEFRTPVPRHAGEVWDIDNLVKPTLDAMDGVFGQRVARRLTTSGWPGSSLPSAQPGLVRSRVLRSRYGSSNSAGSALRPRRLSRQGRGWFWHLARERRRAHNGAVEDNEATQLMLEALFDIRGTVYEIHDVVVGGDDGEAEEEDT